MTFPAPERNRMGLGEPNMPVDARAFVEPAIPEARVHADDEIILLSVPQKIAQIEEKGRVAVVIAANEISIQEHDGVTECAIKPNADALARVLLGDVEGSPVPSHAGFGIAPAKRLVSVRVLLFVADKWQLYSPVRQVQVAPFRVVELIRRKL